MEQRCEAAAAAERDAWAGSARVVAAVVLDVPEDICHDDYQFTAEDFWVDPATTRIPARRSRPSADDIARAAAILGKAKRPLILAGGGIHLSVAWDSLTNFAENLNIPVAHTMSGKGSISCASDLNAGLFGRYSRIANDLIETADCFLAVGCKLGEIATKRYDLLPANVPLIHLDVLEEELGRTTRTEVSLWGDAAAGLDDLGAALADSADAQKTMRAEYAAEIPVRAAAFAAAGFAALGLIAAAVWHESRVERVGPSSPSLPRGLARKRCGTPRLGWHAWTPRLAQPRAPRGRLLPSRSRVRPTATQHWYQNAGTAPRPPRRPTPTNSRRTPRARLHS